MNQATKIYQDFNGREFPEIYTGPTIEQYKAQLETAQREIKALNKRLNESVTQFDKGFINDALTAAETYLNENKSDLFFSNDKSKIESVLFKINTARKVLQK